MAEKNDDEASLKAFYIYFAPSKKKKKENKIIHPIGCLKKKLGVQHQPDSDQLLLGIE